MNSGGGREVVRYSARTAVFTELCTDTPVSLKATCPSLLVDLAGLTKPRPSGRGFFFMG
jgi:hypothetical protein